MLNVTVLVVALFGLSRVAAVPVLSVAVNTGLTINGLASKVNAFHSDTTSIVPISYTRGLSALVSVNCPKGGTMSREFQWRATFTPATAHWTVRGLENIDSVSNVHNTMGTDMRATLRHSFCKNTHERSCHYAFTAATEGSAGDGYIVLGLITKGTADADNLTWMESCVDAGPVPRLNTCPAEGGTACYIQSIHVDILP